MTNVGIGQAMREYLANYKEVERLRAEIKSAELRFMALRYRQSTLEGEITKSVEPVAGSASKPHVRTFTDGTYTTMVVHWDHGLQRGRISITENTP